MSYVKNLNATLNLKKLSNPKYSAIDLFAGCGGLALGFEAAGFETIGYEMLSDACETYNKNLNGTCNEVRLTVEMEYPDADIIIGGPPCQPFSVGGKQLGLEDSRDGFPIFIDAVKKVNPKAFLIENVRGLLYRNKWYLHQVVDALEQLDYKVVFQLLNAKEYGVPQNRQRVIIVGHRSQFSFPNKSQNQVTAGEALGTLAKQVSSQSKFLTKSMDAYIARYEKASKCINPRDLHLDRPARTLTCRNLAGATADMHRIRLSDGRRRRIHTREAARLQSFPDWFKFSGSETNIFNQIGNAVPPLFAYKLAQSMVRTLNGDFTEDYETMVSSRQISLDL